MNGDCPSCGGPFGEHASDCTALEDTLNENQRLLQKIAAAHSLLEPLGNQPIPSVVAIREALSILHLHTSVPAAPDIARLTAQRDELRAALEQIMDARCQTAVRVNIAIENARRVLDKTAPANPNADVPPQAHPKGRWTP